MRHGFSLVELSIVLVILGLLTGGILAGQSLIRGAELRSVSTEFSRYVAAANTFRDKYFALPGDMTNASKFWGAADAANGITAGCITATAAGTCNGNGDGHVLLSTSSNEIFRFWQQLALAGLIEGSYDGITHGINDFSATAANSPRGKMGNSLWFAHWYGETSGVGYMFDGSYGNTLLFGGTAINDVPGASMLKPEEAWNVDTKMDDGKPATGKVAYRSGGGFSACTDSSVNTALGANYLLSNNALACNLIFRKLF